MGVRGLEVCGLGDVVRDPCGWYLGLLLLSLWLSLPCWVVQLVLPLLWVVLPAYLLLLLLLKWLFWEERVGESEQQLGKNGIFITVESSIVSCYLFPQGRTGTTVDFLTTTTRKQHHPKKEERGNHHFNLTLLCFNLI